MRRSVPDKSARQCSRARRALALLLVSSAGRLHDVGADGSDATACTPGQPRRLVSEPFNEAQWKAIAAGIDRAELRGAWDDPHIARAELRWRVTGASGDTPPLGLTLDNRHTDDPWTQRPVFAHAHIRRQEAPAPAILTAASHGGYLLEWWPFVVNKLHFARAADASFFLWTGPMPGPLRAPPAECVCGLSNASAEYRELVPSNHHIKITALLLALDEPSASAAIWVDMDAAFPRPLAAPDLLKLMPDPAPSVAFAQPAAAMRDGKFAHAWPWFVCSCQLAVRDDAHARRFLLLWLAKRCGHKDQTSAWDSIVQLLAEARCYRGPLVEQGTLPSFYARGTYKLVRGAPPDLAQEVKASPTCLTHAPVQLLSRSPQGLARRKPTRLRLSCDLPTNPRYTGVMRDLISGRREGPLPPLPHDHFAIVHVGLAGKLRMDRAAVGSRRWYDEQLVLLRYITMVASVTKHFVPSTAPARRRGRAVTASEGGWAAPPAGAPGAPPSRRTAAPVNNSHMVLDKLSASLVTAGLA